MAVSLGLEGDRAAASAAATAGLEARMVAARWRAPPYQFPDAVPWLAALSAWRLPLQARHSRQPSKTDSTPA